MKKKVLRLENLFSDAEKISMPDKKISVTFAEYKNTVQVEPDDLFKGFDELHAVTFSAGIKQVEHVMKFFKRGAVIIGSPQQITADFAEMLALQKYAVEYVSENKFLQKLIAERKFKFYVTYKVHAKIYLLRAEDGRCRVILSSANLSANAWQVHQLENFVVMDEPKAYEDYFKIFEELRKNSSEEIDKDVRPLKEDGTNLETLPALKQIVNVNKSYVVLHELPPESEEEAKYLLIQRAAADKFREIFKEVGIHAGAEGKTLINAEKIIAMKKVMKTSYEKA